MRRFYPIIAGCLLLAAPGLFAQQVTRRAQISGNAVDGKCTIEVDVDGAAEVEVHGNVGRMRNLSGKRAIWRRFVCNGTLPANPRDFRFRGIDGRGDVRLVQDPRQNGGRIVFRIEDPQGGREGYTVDLEWRGGDGGQWNNQDSRGAWRGPMADTGNAGQAVRTCQTAAAEKMRRDGLRDVSFRDVSPDNNPGRNDYVVGTATARSGWRGSANYQFACSVNLANGQVRSIEVNRR